MHNGKRFVTSTTGYKGVTFHKRDKAWQAQIRVNGKCKYLGFFKTPELAYAAYCKAAKELYGDFARFE